LEKYKQNFPIPTKEELENLKYIKYQYKLSETKDINKKFLEFQQKIENEASYGSFNSRLQNDHKYVGQARDTMIKLQKIIEIYQENTCLKEIIDFKTPTNHDVLNGSLNENELNLNQNFPEKTEKIFESDNEQIFIDDKNNSETSKESEHVKILKEDENNGEIPIEDFETQDSNEGIYN